MTFGIFLGKALFTGDGNQFLKGEICIEELSEKFHTPLEYWSRESYISSWIRSFEERKLYGNRVALVTLFVCLLS